MKTYDASVIANAFIHTSRGFGVPAPSSLTHMKLQKLVFFVHAWGLALYGQSPVKERPQAWEYGPVFDTLYHELKEYGAKPVTSYLLQMNPKTGKREALIPSQDSLKFNRLFNQVREKYGNLSALHLSELSHEDGSPWEKARQRAKGWLDDDATAAFYRAKLNNHA